MNIDKLLLTDSYKVTHANQYPPGTTTVFSYLESRGGEFDEVVFFGLQYFIEEYLKGQFVTQEGIDRAEEFIAGHLGSKDLFNRKGWEYILKEHDGRLPIRIKAVREGSVLPNRQVLMTVENTDPKCWWLTNWLETLLVQVWYPTTVASLSRKVKKLILGFLESTGTPALIDYKYHDFGFRGVSSVESAALGGAGHLVNFMGTDTMPAIVLARDYYFAGICGHSVPASEHSTMTSWTKPYEGDAFENMLDQNPTGIVACVSDSYDIIHACKVLWGQRLKEKILARDGTLVVRPDSGDPVESVITVLRTLGKAFGTTLNDKGYKVLPPQVRVIQGDGIDYVMTFKILTAMETDGWSADNIAFGSGGGLLQKLNRDTLSFAFKCSSIIRNGKEVDVFKDPAFAPEKASKRGRLTLVKRDDGSYVSMRVRDVLKKNLKEELKVVFEDGKAYGQTTFDAVRERAALGC
ncbi:MAG: nicotinate phosphoribosyltransferase [Deltaproteobacteria bacterium]|nr:nicotinate phosphoribosyltransferase [Deltaproteobacteria bacterium]